MRSYVPSGYSSNTDSMEAVVIRHLVLVNASLLNEVAFTSADPMRAIHLLSWSKPKFLPRRTRILIVHLFFGLVVVLRTGSKQGVDLGLCTSDAMRQVNILKDIPGSRRCLHSGATFPRAKIWDPPLAHVLLL